MPIRFMCARRPVSCSQPDYSGLLMSCQTVDWVTRGVVVSSGSSPLTCLAISEQGFGFLVSGGGHGLQLFATRLSQVICSFISWNPTVGRDPLLDHGVFMGEKLQVFQQLVDWLVRGIGYLGSNSAVIQVCGTYGRVCLLIGCWTSEQHASISHGRICSDNFTCCHTEIEVADQTFHLTQSQYTYTGPTSPSADPITPGAWQGSHWSANFEVTGMTLPRKNPVASGIRTRDLPLWRRTHGRGSSQRHHHIERRRRRNSAAWFGTQGHASSCWHGSSSMMANSHVSNMLTGCRWVLIMSWLHVLSRLPLWYPFQHLLEWSRAGVQVHTDTHTELHTCCLDSLCDIPFNISWNGAELVYKYTQTHTDTHTHTHTELHTCCLASLR